MQYELTETEIKHIEKYRKLWPGDKKAVDDLIARMAEQNEKIEQLKKAEK